MAASGTQLIPHGSSPSHVLLQGTVSPTQLQGSLMYRSLFGVIRQERDAVGKGVSLHEVMEPLGRLQGAPFPWAQPVYSRAVQILEGRSSQLGTASAKALRPNSIPETAQEGQ